MSEKSEALRLAENLENPWWGMTASPSGLPEVSLVAVAALRADAARLLREQHARLLREQHAAPSEDIDALRQENERLREALTAALDNGCQTVYVHEYDIGRRGCCGELSYEDHTEDCWTVRAAAALRLRLGGTCRER